MVGTSGNDGERAFPVTASARSLPSRICGTTGGMELNTTGTWPATAAATAGPAPLYGTCTTSSPTERPNCAPTRCVTDPVPPELKVSRESRALAKATNSATVLAGTDGLTAKTTSLV